MKKSLYVALCGSTVPRVIGIARVTFFDKNGKKKVAFGRVGQRSDTGRISKPKHIYSDWMEAQDELDRYADQHGWCWVKANRSMPQIAFDDYTREVRGCLFHGQLKQNTISWRTRWKIITK